MRKPKRTAFVLSTTLVCLFLFAAALAAQGTSPIKVTAIKMSPTTFKAGESVMLTVTLWNGSKSKYGCSGMKAVIYAFKGKPYTVTNQIWKAEELVGPMAGGEKRDVTFSTKFTAPAANYPKLHFMAWSPVCAPDEFGQNAILVVGQECYYRFRSRSLVIKPLPVRPVRKPIK